MATLGDYMQSTSKEVELLKNDIAVFLNLINERKHPLDLLRELLSNAAAREVAATKIEISYTRDREGHIFEISDNGCGMNFTGKQTMPGRLDRFLGLGLSAIAGQSADEFAFKGLGSKLAYQSHRVEVETRFEGHPLYMVKVNEPWETLKRHQLPKPLISDYPDSAQKPGTRIRVVGHPPHKADASAETFSFEQIRAFLQHRTFAGFTRSRENPPEIVLSVLGQTQPLEFGFPEFRGIEWRDGFTLQRENKTLLVNIVMDSSKVGPVRLKGLLTWDADLYGLGRSKLNTGLILSSRGIPYFESNMGEYGSRSIVTANPGVDKICLVVECEGVHAQMNIARSDLVDSAETDEFKRLVRQLIQKLEASQEYLAFRQIQKEGKREASAEHLAREKLAIEAEDQNWVVYQTGGNPPVVLMREPKNENEVNALIWKLEALKALPFERFQTLAYVGAKRGPDLLVNLREDKTSEPLRGAIIEVELNFYNYTSHGHTPSQYARVICWDAPTSGRKIRFTATTNKPYRFSIPMGDYTVYLYVLKNMDGLSVMSRRDLKARGIDI